ncbi:MAG: response regulator transcription factor [Bryobacterales bacterium]|nr:response regulator transcription factor [Bryobacterales bacterium]MBV9400020.1 response regulator transcription factor [Bryobacterales bacterium]
MPLPLCSVLVVDDEAPLRTVLRSSFAATGCDVEEARNGEEALDALQRRSFDLVLLDINMPGMSGLQACRKIRAAAPGMGIVMLTVRDDEDDKVNALEAGADDYITKPFRIRELTARLSAVLRRTRTSEPAAPTELRAGDLALDEEKRTLRRGEELIRLAPKEFELLAFMMRNKGLPLSHVKLLRSIWGPEYGGELEYLRTYVRTLRKKIEDNPAKPKYIVTEPWVGYRFIDPADENGIRAPSEPAQPSQL